ncbi:hypothetical protein [Aeromicrobium endophyticum]|uniref:hypothetical protein n=1 Tax=Aeromicrobium endophyticum TaxID=2292704 RepID=UPI001F469316
MRQLQTLYYDGKVNGVSLRPSHSVQRVPDFARLADALGCVGLECDAEADVDSVIMEAVDVTDVPVVIYFRVNDEFLVWPTIAAGAGNDDLQHARGLAPTFANYDVL